MIAQTSAVASTPTAENADLGSALTRLDFQPREAFVDVLADTLGAAWTAETSAGAFSSDSGSAADLRASSGDAGAGTTAPTPNSESGSIVADQQTRGSGDEEFQAALTQLPVTASSVAATPQLTLVQQVPTTNTAGFVPAWAPTTRGALTTSAYVTTEDEFNGGFEGGGSGNASSAQSGGANGVLISQVYGGGGQSGSSFQQDFVELLNTSPDTVSLSGWSLQYAEATSDSWQVAALSGSIDPGQYLLVWGVTGTAGQQAAPTADVTTSLDLGAENGKVALVNSTGALLGQVPTGTSLVDVVGYGSANAYEGNAAAPSLALDTAAFRFNGGLNDGDDNFADFYADVPAPRNSTATFANLPPTNSVPNTQYVPQDTAFVFSSALGNAVAVGDYNGGSNPLEVTLEVTAGALTLATLSGLTFSAGDGTADASMTFQGTSSAINAALNGLSYQPPSGFVDIAVLIVVSDDLDPANPQFTVDCTTLAVGAPLFAQADDVWLNEDRSINVDVLANDVLVNDQMVLLTILTGTSLGTAGIMDNGTPSGWDDYITYTPFDDYEGTDSLTYRITDINGNSATATVTFTIRDVNDARIVPPMPALNYEGDPVSLPLLTPDRSANSALQFTATNLPLGLSINSMTGLISGTIDYTAAETNNGVYAVTVTATGVVGGDGDSHTFSWSIENTNLLPWIDNKVTPAGEAINLEQQLIAGVTNTSFTWSATGLPPGLTIEPGHGVITGSPEAQGSPITSFTTTITATDYMGTSSDSRTFTWTVLSGTNPIVMFALNGTFVTNDDIAMLDPALPLSAKVLLYAPEEQGSVSIALDVPSGLSSVSSSTVVLAHGQTTTVMLTPLAVSLVEDDVVLRAFIGAVQRGEAKAVNMAGIEISTMEGNAYLNRIRNSSTPAGMVDRIRPRVGTSLTIKFAGPALETKQFTAAVVGESGDNGKAYFFVSGVPLKVAYGAVITPGNYAGNTFQDNIIGCAQTQPGSAGNLKLAVFRGVIPDLKNNNAVAVHESAGFSVAAIPYEMVYNSFRMLTAAQKERETATHYVLGYGGIYSLYAQSDSYVNDDMDKVEVTEEVQRVGAPTGYFLKTTLRTGKVVRASLPFFDFVGAGRNEPKVDEDGLLVTQAKAKAAFIKVLKVAGKETLEQYFNFKDERTGAPAQKIKYSGFEMIQEIKTDTAGVWKFFVSRTAKAYPGVLGGSVLGTAAGTHEDPIQ